jgi:enamine deaminase RidA (YjgF/YER057c/UK114 family)
VTLDHALPAPNVPVGSYMMAIRTGNLLFLSGHGAFEDGRPVHTGRLGETMTTEQGARAAEAVMLNLLATVRAELGDLSRVARVVKVVVFVNSTPDFTEQHVVANGAIDLLAGSSGPRVDPLDQLSESPACRWASRSKSRLSWRLASRGTLSPSRAVALQSRSAHPAARPDPVSATTGASSNRLRPSADTRAPPLNAGRGLRDRGLTQRQSPGTVETPLR